MPPLVFFSDFLLVGSFYLKKKTTPFVYLQSKKKEQPKIYDKSMHI